ncbi:hypothetical protein ACFCVY_01590 [Streptomyces sp. NPDC056411]|uniref:hypothetical protein n=1 Tax=Streptomyces sp. NPDC056411 TaxID=3345813 RepID=UPI0035E0242B
MTLDEQLTTVDALRRRDFPAQRTHSARTESGPGFHIAALRVSRELWDADPAEVAEAEEELGAALTALVGALSLRWGEPEVLDLSGVLERSARGLPVRPPLDALCGYVPRMYAWRSADRWIAVGVGQGDPVLPLQLLVAVGEGEATGAAGAPGRGR